MFNSMEYRSRNQISNDDLLRERPYSDVLLGWKKKTKQNLKLQLLNKPNHPYTECYHSCFHSFASLTSQLITVFSHSNVFLYLLS